MIVLIGRLTHAYALFTAICLSLTVRSRRSAAHAGAEQCCSRLMLS